MGGQQEERPFITCDPRVFVSSILNAGVHYNVELASNHIHCVCVVNLGRFLL